MMHNRQKLLLQVVHALSTKGIFSRTYLVKTLFLLRQKFSFDVVGYDFFPYKYGPFSNEIYNDFKYLEEKGLFNETELCLTNKGKEFIKELKENKSVFSELNKIITKFQNTSKIKDFVYTNYLDFTIRSNSIKTKKLKEKGFCSIGYESKTIDGFLNELIQNNVSLLIDVRRNAFSMKRGFSKSKLKNYLEKAGIEYKHLPELGIESEKRKELNTEKDYKELFKKYQKLLPKKKEQIMEIKELGEKNKIALMCFEADKNFCHRGVLSGFLDEKVVHI